MIGSLGFWEIALIVVLALLLFGPKKLPELGRTVGRTMRQGQRAINELKNALDVEATETVTPGRPPELAQGGPPAAVSRQGSGRPDPASFAPAQLDGAESPGPSEAEATPAAGTAEAPTESTSAEEQARPTEPAGEER